MIHLKFPLNPKNRNKNYISYSHYINQNKDINVYNIARDAADNATISRNLINIVNEIDSFDSISKSYGISNEHVYLIKANFR